MADQTVTVSTTPTPYQVKVDALMAAATLLQGYVPPKGQKLADSTVSVAAKFAAYLSS